MKSDEFLREVDEAVRRERWLSLWSRYRGYIIGGMIAVVVGTAAGVGWRHYQESSRLDEARRFAAGLRLLEQGRAGEAAGLFAELANEADSGFMVLARLREAEAEGEAENRQAKIETLRSLAGDASASATYRSLARLLEAQVELETGNDSAVETLTEGQTDGVPWQASATELRALARLQAGEPQLARELLQELVEDPATPVSLSQRASELLASLGGPLEEPGEGDGSSE